MLAARTLTIQTSPVFEPLLHPARYKGCYGGRGSGKSHFFAELLIEDCLMHRGLRAACIREVQKSLKESAKRLIEDKLDMMRLGEADGFKVFADVIRTPGDGIIIFQGMQDHTAESVKSLEGFGRAWCEEAQSLSARSLALLRPTIRDDDSELWFSFNPRRKSDPVDILLRGPVQPSNSIVVKANWSDNVWFPKVLEQERRDCMINEPDQYNHIWEGGYATVLAGAYYARHISEARLQGRIGVVSADPHMSLKAVWDIGGAGAQGDATSIWIVQFVGDRILLLDYYEAVGQPLGAHLNWLRSRGYGNAECILPHDGAVHDKISGVRYIDHIRAAEFEARDIKNQGKGAALKRVEAARHLFPKMWFNELTCAPGLDAIGFYHEKRDEDRNVGLGPDHDWSSHAADAFGLVAVAYEEPQPGRERIMERPRLRGIV